ncbi:MAG: tRNA lysidine(34) synthetase TilS [Bacteroidales bacterium]|nr:tRNA lysidine(34) synthetase TilS [Bacteroidales bacterium]
MLQRFADYIRLHGLIAEGERTLLAVSGGRDSVCLAHLAHQLHLPFAIAHCNFHLRPSDCDRDQEFVRSLAQSLHVPFFTTDFDTHAYAQAQGYSLEQAARLLRYAYFAHLCQSEHYSRLATAHHLDDSIETFFLNLFRGTGIAGLHGILPLSHLTLPPTDTAVADAPPISLTVVHPMLCFSRAEIDAYLAQHQLAYVDDSTNFEPEVQRNRIRLQLMPLLRELYPSVDTTMQANIHRLHEVEQVYRLHIEDLRRKLCHRVAPRLPWLSMPIDAFPLTSLATLSPRSTLLFELLRPYGFNASVVANIEASLPSPQSGSQFCSPTHRAAIDRDQLLVAPIPPPTAPTLTIRETTLPSSPRTDACQIYVAPTSLRLPLRLRPWHPADRFCPFGMSGSRLVSDFLKDAKLNALEKPHVQLLVDASDRVVWVVGLRADNRFRVHQAGDACWLVSVSQ